MQIIVEDAANTTRPAPMGDEEVFIGPSLEAVVIGRIMRVAGAFHLAVKMSRVLGVFDAGVQIRPAAEPRGARGPEHAGVHMDGRGMRVDHMRHQRDARGPEPRIRLHPRHAARGHGLLRACAQGAMHFGPVDANLFKDAAAAQDRHDSAAAIFGAAGRGDLKGHGRLACWGGADL